MFFLHNFTFSLPEIDINSLGATSADYSIDTLTVTFEAGAVSEFIILTILDDHAVEGSESFTLTLRDPSAGDCPNGNRGDPYILPVTIEDNDGKENYVNSINTSDSTL